MLETFRKLFHLDGARSDALQASRLRVALAKRAIREQHNASVRAARVIAEMERTEAALRGSRDV